MIASLRFRLLLLVIVAAVPAFLLVGYTGIEQRRAEADDAQTAALGLARFASTEQQRIIDETQRLLITLAQIPVVRDGDADACSRLFADLLTRFGHYTNLALLLPNGDMICSATPLQGPVNVADRRYFQRVLQTHDFALGDYVIGRVSGKAALLTGLPILDPDGSVRYIVHAGIDLTWLNRFAAEAHLAPGSRLAVADRRGTLLVRYPNPEAWVGKNLVTNGLVTPRVVAGERQGVGEGVGAEGVRRIYAFVPLGNPGLDDEVFVSVAIPSAVAYAEADRLLQRNLAALAAVVALALAAAWYGSDLFLLRQVRRLVAAARCIAAGDLGARSGLGRQDGELGQVGRAFDEMAVSLERRNAERQRAEAERALLTAAIGRERAMLSAMLASMSQGVITVNAGGRALFCSARAGSLLGIDAGSLIGHPVEVALEAWGLIAVLHRGAGVTVATSGVVRQLLARPQGAAGAEPAGDRSPAAIESGLMQP